MVERREVRLDDADVIAGAQILGWIAFPNRHEHGFRTLQQWAMRRQFARGEIEGIPAWFDKPNRLQLRINTLEKQLVQGLRAGDWLAKRICKEADTPLSGAFGRGRNAQALRENKLIQIRDDTDHESDLGDIDRDFWRKRAPILHLASAAVFAILDAHTVEGREHFDLGRTVFSPD